MSLFPAYSGGSGSKQNASQSETVIKVEAPEPAVWLENASFDVALSDIPLPGSAGPPQVHAGIVSEDTQSPTPPPSPVEEKKKRRSSSHKKRSKEHEKHEHKRRRTEFVRVIGLTEEENFYEDKTSARGNLKVKTLSRPAVPLYHSRFSALSWVSSSGYWSKKKKRLKKKRYYLCIQELPEKLEKLDEDGENPPQEAADTKTQPSLSDNRLEEELSRRTAEFNKTLADEPLNEQMWLKYVRFQDMVWQFERIYRRGGGAKGIRVTADRKLSILDKALSHNPGSQILLRERFLVAENVLPADVMSRQLSEMLERQPSCIMLWRGYIQNTQCSLTLCNATAVLKLYEQGMNRLHQLRRGALTTRTQPMEDGILDLLLDCGSFLRQAGLWEQLWMLLKMHLELNLAKSKSELFNDIQSSSVSEEYVTSLEERILSSQLPLPELWYRVERLREGAHWFPWSYNTDCEDPQRLVFPDDVSDMLHPVTSPGLNFRLVMIILTLLKVPLLPCRSTTLQYVGADQVPWYLDFIEPLLAVFYPQGTVELEDESLLKGTDSLVYGPQYLLDQKVGQEQYLQFITKLFALCSECLSEPLKTAVCVWWLRFERFLLILDRHGRCKLPPSRKKKTKSMVKEFMKKEVNRNNGLFYLEYALVEKELGQREGACVILQTVIAAQQGGMSVISIVCEHQKANVCCLYRTLCEFFLGTNSDVLKSDDKNALHVLVTLGSGLPHLDLDAKLKEEKIAVAADKFHHITMELFADVGHYKLANGSEHLLPHFLVDWVTCHAWFLLLTTSPWEAAALFEKALTHLPPARFADRSVLTVAMCRREAIFESYVSMLHHHCRATAGAYSVLQEVLHRALKEFPNNLHFLATVASIETSLGCVGSPWWKLTRYFNENTSLLAPVFQVFLAQQKQAQLEQARIQSHVFLSAAGPVIPCPSGKNRLHAMFKQFLKAPTTKRCPLLWRLYLQFLSEQGKESLYNSTFYRAVEECPWVKVLYVEATKLLPAQLPQLQDLLMEKELRVHVTPEELDILRSDPPTT